MQLREQALEWWRALSLKKQHAMAEKHYEGLTFFMVSASSSMIERMYTSELELKKEKSSK